MRKFPIQSSLFSWSRYCGYNLPDDMTPGRIFRINTKGGSPTQNPIREDHCPELHLFLLCPVQPLGQGNKDFGSRSQQPTSSTAQLTSGPTSFLSTKGRPTHQQNSSKSCCKYWVPVYLIFMFLPPKSSPFSLIQSLASSQLFLHKASSPTLKDLQTVSFKAMIWTFKAIGMDNIKEQRLGETI